MSHNANFPIFGNSLVPAWRHEERTDCNATVVTEVLQKMMKQRRESIFADQVSRSGVRAVRL